MTQSDPTLTDALPSPPPLLRVVSGDPSDDELAALVAVVATAVTSPGPVQGGATTLARSAWRDRAQLLRRPHFAGPGAWRASSWTR